MGKNKQQVPRLRFPGFNDAWEQRKLGEVGQIYTGNTPPTSDKDNWSTQDNEYIWITPTDINSLTTNKSERYLSKKGWDKARVVPKHSILITSIASIGKNTINSIPAAFNQQINAIVPKNNDAYFILSAMIKNVEKFASLAGRTATPIINKTTFQQFALIIPLEPEQTAIGNFFRQLDEAIAAHQRKLEKIKELKNSLLHKMFPKDGETVPELRFSGFTDAWEQGRLGAITEIFDNLRIPVTENLRAHGHTPYYGANGIQGFIDGFTHDGEFILIAEDGANNLKNYPIQYTVGKIWVNNHAHVLKGVDEVLNSLFLAYCMKSMDISKYLVGGTRAKLTSSAMKSITIIFPSLQEQTAIGNFFRQLDTVIEAYQQKSNQLHTLKTALLGKMFV